MDESFLEDLTLDFVLRDESSEERVKTRRMRSRIGIVGTVWVD